MAPTFDLKCCRRSLPRCRPSIAYGTQLSVTFTCSTHSPIHLQQATTPDGARVLIANGGPSAFIWWHDLVLPLHGTCSRRSSAIIMLGYGELTALLNAAGGARQSRRRCRPRCSYRMPRCSVPTTAPKPITSSCARQRTCCSTTARYSRCHNRTLHRSSSSRRNCSSKNVARR